MKSFLLSLSSVIIVLFSFISVSFAETKVGFPPGAQCNGIIQNMGPTCQQTATGTKSLELKLSPPYDASTINAPSPYITINVQATTQQCANSIAKVTTSPTQIQGNTDGLTYSMSNSGKTTQVSTITLVPVAGPGGFQCPNGIWFNYISGGF